MRQILQHPISTGEVTALPLTQVQPSGTAFAGADPMEPAGHAPLGATNQAGIRPPCRDRMPWDGLCHGWRQSSAPPTLGHRMVLWHRMLTTRKRSDQDTLVRPAATTVVEGCVGTIGSRGIHPAQIPPGPMDDAAQHVGVIDPLPTLLLIEEGADASGGPPPVRGSLLP